MRARGRETTKMENTTLNARLWAEKAATAFARATDYHARAGEAEIATAKAGDNWAEAGASLRQIAEEWEQEAIASVMRAQGRETR